MNKKNIDVICVGQAVVDCIMKSSGNDSNHNIVEIADSITLSPGGDAFNESVVLSRLGHNVQIVCGLGNDSAGDIITNKLIQNSVNTDAIFHSDTAQTPVAIILVAADGSRRSVSSAAHRAHFYEPDISLLQGAKVVSLASLFRAPFNCAKTILAVCKAAKDAGSLITADTKLTYNNEMTLSDIKEALPYIDYLFPNETEAEYYTNMHTYPEMADTFLDYGVKNVIIKTGPKGCFVKNKNEQFIIPAKKVQAIDTTGAGDNFAAGFISSLLQGSELRTCAQFATACASLCVQNVGATSGVQNRTQVEGIYV